MESASQREQRAVRGSTSTPTSSASSCVRREPVRPLLSDCLWEATRETTTELLGRGLQNGSQAFRRRIREARQAAESCLATAPMEKYSAYRAEREGQARTNGSDDVAASTRRVLVIVQGELGDRPSGPQIRGWEIARALAARHAVTIAASTSTDTEYGGIPVVPRARRRLLAQVATSNVVIAPLLPPYLMAALARRSCLRVADLYDPVDLEIGTLPGGRSRRRALAAQQALRRMQLRWSDVVISANERQRHRAAREVEALGRSDSGPVHLTVPVGLSGPPAEAHEHPLRRRFAIPLTDPLVLWWGSVWRWLDAGTAVRAVERLARRNPRIRLVITAGVPPHGTDALDATEEARELARGLGLLDRNVFFLNEWVPYEKRHLYLADADLGLTLHSATPESSLAARTRYMDYLWATLPSVLAEGDELAGEMAAAGAAWLVKPRDPAATAGVIESALACPGLLAQAREACRELCLKYHWPNVIDPLIRQIETMVPNSYPLPSAARLVQECGAFYARRAVDICVAA